MVCFDICFNIKLLRFHVYVFLPLVQLAVAPVGKCVIGQGLRGSGEIEETWNSQLSTQHFQSILGFTLGSGNSRWNTSTSTTLVKNSDDFCHKFILGISSEASRRNWEERRKCIDSFVAGIK